MQIFMTWPLAFDGEKSHARGSGDSGLLNLNASAGAAIIRVVAGDSQILGIMRPDVGAARTGLRGDVRSGDSFAATRWGRRGETMAEEQKLNRPWLVAVWPGMGQVAISAGYYLMAKLGMHLLAELPAAGALRSGPR